jgi:putative ABC transport system ATP-binding protein
MKPAKDNRNVLSFDILKPDKVFFVLAVIYGIGIGVLTLTVPISVQALLNTVVNTGLSQFVVVLAVVLFLLLLISSFLIACREYAMELFQRRFMARVSAEIALRMTQSEPAHMESINRAELVNRFFEIMHVQKNVPALLTEGFFIALQATVGLVLVSFYHPFLFAYNVVFAGGIYVIWAMWAPRATQQAIAVSDSKYNLVRWLEEIARVNPFFKSTKTTAYALSETDSLISSYLDRKKSYFHSTFKQKIAFLFLYCLANAVLLGLGGVLVVSNQLSLGQLIGAELIMSAIFYSVSKLGYYASIYYDLRANLNKLDYFFQLPVEQAATGISLLTDRADIKFENVLVAYRGHNFAFDCSIPGASKTSIKSWTSSGSKVFVDLLKSYKSPEYGKVLFGGVELVNFDPYALRENILSIDNLHIVEGSIQQLFNFYKPDIRQAEIASYLPVVELEDTIKNLPSGLDTQLVPSGYPLLNDEIIRLKLAASLAAQPKILVITEVFDVVPLLIRRRILDRLCHDKNITLIYFTNRKELDGFNNYIAMDKHGMTIFNSLQEYSVFEAAHEGDR